MKTITENGIEYVVSDRYPATPYTKRVNVAEAKAAESPIESVIKDLATIKANQTLIMESLTKIKAV